MYAVGKLGVWYSSPYIYYDIQETASLGFPEYELKDEAEVKVGKTNLRITDL